MWYAQRERSKSPAYFEALDLPKVASGPGGQLMGRRTKWDNDRTVLGDNARVLICVGSFSSASSGGPEWYGCAEAVSLEWWVELW